MNRRLWAQETKYEQETGCLWEESMEEYKLRAQKIAYSLPQNVVYKCCMRTAHNIQAMATVNGWYITG